eukprot:TRINITY_DN31504_c0_g1_i1.p1 TRINITY_DN31504_c0_g1~~TRINITY_DN31504_c0_g1_i1.p1  ORF type:complete len:297 (+),score=83.33 TRINITY_DN31504_c0_g1_i1:111-1001(+)
MAAMALLEQLSSSLTTGLRRKPDTSSAFQAVLKSFALVAAAPAVASRCVYAVARKTTMMDLEEFRAAFDHCDRDSDGLVSRADLYATLSLAQCHHVVDTNLLFAAADVDNAGYLDFRKFAAACLYERLAPLDDWLAKEAFSSLDADADGFVTAEDVFKIFGFVPAGLPSYRSFDVYEWTASLQPDMQAKAVEVSSEAQEDRKKQCGGDLLRGGLLSGCLKKRSNHRRQASAFEAVDENTETIWALPQDDRNLALMHPNSQMFYSPSTCSQEAWRRGQQYPHGTGFSSPAYVPFAHY